MTGSPSLWTIRRSPAPFGFALSVLGEVVWTDLTIMELSAQATKETLFWAVLSGLLVGLGDIQLRPG